MGRKKVAEKKEGRSLSCHRKDFENWEAAAKALNMRSTNAFIERAANKLAAEALGGIVVDLSDQVTAQSKALKTLHSEMTELREANVAILDEIRAVTKSLKQQIQLETA